MPILPLGSRTWATPLTFRHLTPPYHLRRRARSRTPVPVAIVLTSVISPMSSKSIVRILLEFQASRITSAFSCGARPAFKLKGKDYLRNMLSRRQLQGFVIRAVGETLLTIASFRECGQVFERLHEANFVE